MVGYLCLFRLFTTGLGRGHAGDNILLPLVTTFTVANELVLPVVAYAAGITVVRFFFKVAPLVIVAITDRGEALVAVLALVGLFSGMDAHVNQKVSTLIKKLLAVRALIVARTEISHLHALDLAPSPNGGRVRRVRGYMVLDFAGSAALERNLAEGADAGAEGGARAELLDQNYVLTADVLKVLVRKNLLFAALSKAYLR